MSLLHGRQHIAGLTWAAGQYATLPKIPTEGYYKKKKEITEPDKKEHAARMREHDVRGNETIESIEKTATERGKKSAQSYVFPGHQGVLGEIGGERPSEPEWHKPIAEHSEAEKAARVSDIAKQLGVPMEPGRQISAWANKQHVPKAEGGQGTLFAPARYRP